MNISYKWLSDYLPVTIEPEKLSRILTSIGLEVESFHKYEEIRGGLEGLVIGEVLNISKHPNADKLTITQVNIGKGEPLKIVCGASNVAIGQKVVVAPVGTTIYPLSGEPITLKKAKIRGEESQGMICAEDEIGLGNSHEGILVLNNSAKSGMSAQEYFQLYEDWIYEIGLTPNRMDAMSHWGVARDVCAWISHHEIKHCSPRIPVINNFKPDNGSFRINVQVENSRHCPRYSGVTISGITIHESPAWLQKKLKSIGLRPINNIVDITNFIQHETGQPLHAFDADELSGRQVIVKNLPEGTRFVTLDEKERNLSAEDLMICDTKGGVCIAGVFGGRNSGVTEKTKNIFLESACFDPVSIRKTSFRHGLRTDAASRFEKGTDISATVNVLKRAATMIREIAGGEIASEIVDIYPEPPDKKQIGIKYHYLKKLSGKNYHPDTVKNILSSLGFEVVKERIDELWVAVPYNKPDINLPADIVEEIIRIDGLDNIEIPQAITITPSIEENLAREIYRDKVEKYLVGAGFNEIITNSITSSVYFTEEELKNMVRMQNSLSAELDVMRPSLFETSLEVARHNLNHRNRDLKLFEFGRAYRKERNGKYGESEQLGLLVTGQLEKGWKNKPSQTDIFYLKGIVHSLLDLMGLQPEHSEALEASRLDDHFVIKLNGEIMAGVGAVRKKVLDQFEIKQPVYFAGINWDELVRLATHQRITIHELPRFPSVQRDLAMIVPKELPYQIVEETVQKLNLDKLQSLNLFDIFESDKLGRNKKSMAINFIFLDREKTLTDVEIEGYMTKIMDSLEKKLQVEIRKR